MSQERYVLVRLYYQSVMQVYDISRQPRLCRLRPAGRILSISKVVHRGISLQFLTFNKVLCFLIGLQSSHDYLS